MPHGEGVATRFLDLARFVIALVAHFAFNLVVLFFDAVEQATSLRDEVNGEALGLSRI